MCNDDIYDEEKKMREDKWKLRKEKKRKENKKRKRDKKKKQKPQKKKIKKLKKKKKKAKVAHIVLALCWPISCIRPLWYCFKSRPI
jgi:hypothetical protein